MRPRVKAGDVIEVELGAAESLILTLGVEVEVEVDLGDGE
jgi:hypothetical protein